ncbi:box C/D snoRNA protein 1-like [Halichondria panicea]|uniref:box C/D snoRNA protein 1-like n=1 Tax=Halichondria panicea TaxID=6063 RepID=UPI00312B3B1E
MDGNQLCEVCHQQSHKYKCPGCAKKSCSVECVKRHKVEFVCSGRRCKSSFVKLSNFNDNQLHSDYYFLEDVSRYVDSTLRERIQSNKHHKDSNQISQQMHWLRVHAGRRSIHFLSQPPGMAKHKINRSKTIRTKDGKWSICWTVRLIFRDTDVDCIEHNVPEGVVLVDLLNRFVHPTKSDPILRHRLRLYSQEDGMHQLQVLLKNETSPINSSNEVLDIQKTLCDNFQDKTIVEFPVMIIGNKDTHTSPVENSPVNNSKSPLSEASPVIMDISESPVEVHSDWSDYEEGEVREAVSSLQLIAQEYGDD